MGGKSVGYLNSTKDLNSTQARNKYNGPLPRCPKPLFNNEAFDMKVDCSYHTNKTNNHKNSFSLGFVWKVRPFRTQNGLSSVGVKHFEVGRPDFKSSSLKVMLPLSADFTYTNLKSNT